VVVPRPGSDVQLAHLGAFASGRLAAFKCPEALCVVSELAKTATGKVAKSAVRAQVAHVAEGVERAW
jgi:long-chain acyl-CoA synthetase